MYLAISLASLAIIAVCAVVILRPRPPGPEDDQMNAQGTLEKIREVGDLCALKAHVKEVVTLKTNEPWHTSDGKMLLICSFEIEFRYDLQNVEIEPIGQSGRFRITIPPHSCKVLTDKIEFYHEEKPQMLLIKSQDFTVEQRNKMIEHARSEATKQAQALHQSIQGKVQASAEATLRAISKAFGAEQVEFRFLKLDTANDQIREGMQKLAA